ncbi:MAG: class I SAM-dependent methyltransferase [Phycisphaeraceae bacterium]
MLERILEPEVMDDPEEAAAYDAMDHRDANTAFVDRLIELGITNCSNALDLGTGPGDIPILLCQRVEGIKTLAVDLAQSMLDRAANKIEQARLNDRIALEKLDVKALDLPSDAFDAVFSNTILHHLPEPALMLSEAKRVLRPGGLLLIRDLYRPDSREERDALVTLHTKDCDDAQRRLFADSLQAALTPVELRSLAASVGLTTAEVVIDSDRHVSLQRRAHSR